MTVFSTIRPLFSTRTAIGIVIFALIYHSVSELSLLFKAPITDNIAAIWPAVGIGFAVLFLWGYRFWPGIWLSEASNLVLYGELTEKQLMTATGNTVAVIIGVWLVRRFVSGQDLLARSFYVFTFISLGAVLTSLLSASSGITALALFETLSDSELLTLWWTWCLADTVGILVVAPLIISWQTHRHSEWYRPKQLEVFLSLLSFILILWLVFGQPVHNSIQAYPLTFLLMPIPIWAAFQFSQRQTILIIFLLSVVAVIATTQGSGPFVRASLYESLLLLQTFIAVISITILFLLAVINERSALEENLRQSQLALQAAKDELELQIIERTSSLRQANEQLQETTAKYQSIFINAIEGIYQLTPEGRLLSANPALARMYGYRSAEEMMNYVNNMETLYVDSQRRREFHQQIRQSGAVQKFEATVYRKDGDIMCISENSRAICDEQGQLLYYEGTMIDVTDRKQAEEQLVKMAHYDALTGLANRRLFQARLRNSLAHARNSGKMGVLMYFDLDGFKQVNDNLGHEFGDELLKQAAQRLKSCVRDSDEVCRLGGDEFTLIAKQVSCEHDAAIIAKKIIVVLSQPYDYQEQQARIGVSIGITFFDGHNYDTDSLIRQADQAMYWAKQSGKGTYRFYAQLDENSAP